MKTIPITVSFTAAQHKRLADAAQLLSKTTRRKITVEDMIVAGAMAGLDFSASSLKDASEAIGYNVTEYARGRVTFASPENGTHDALQSCRLTA